MNKSIYEITTSMTDEEVFKALEEVSVEKANMFTGSRYIGKVTTERFNLMVILQSELKLKGQIKAGESGSIVRFEIQHPAKFNMQIALLNGLLLPFALVICTLVMVMAPLSFISIACIVVSGLVYFGLRAWFKFTETKPDPDHEARYLAKLLQGQLKVLEQPQSSQKKKLAASTAKS